MAFQKASGKYETSKELEEAVIKDWEGATIPPKGLVEFYEAMGAKHGVSLSTILRILARHATKY